jgi:hypothetical protein
VDKICFHFAERRFIFRTSTKLILGVFARLGWGRTFEKLFTCNSLSVCLQYVNSIQFI